MTTATLSHYHTAKRTMLIAQDSLTRQWYHIFSVTELQPPDIPPYSIPTKEWYNGQMVRAKKSSGVTDYTFYLYIDDVSITQAVEFFGDPLHKTFITEHQLQFFNSTFVKEPGGDHPLVFPANYYKTAGVTSILPKRNSSLMVRTLIDHERATEKMFSSGTFTSSIQQIDQLTQDWLGFSLAAKPEHLGNMYLCAPDPYFRDIDFTLSTNPPGVFYQIKRRKGVNEKLVMHLIDKHGDGIAQEKKETIENSVGLILLDHEPHLLEVKVYNEQDELIHVQGPFTFLRSIQLDMSVKQADLEVNVNTEKGAEKFTVEKFSKERPSIIGTVREFNKEMYFQNAEHSRKHLEHKRTTDFIFFEGGKTEAEKSALKTKAKETVREIIERANDSCYLCDPYFMSYDVIQYAYRTKISGVTVRILNCKEFISKKEAKKLLQVITDYNNKPFGKIELRLLRGGGILHDRFIAVDKKVWYVGSSFNEIGNRATCIGRVPDSSDTEILKQMERWFFDNAYSQTIEEYLES